MKLRWRKFVGEVAFIEHRKTAKRVEKQAFTAFFKHSHDSSWYFAVVASRRLGGAVERNRAKRRLRAVFSAISHSDYAPLSLILQSKPAALKRGFADMVNDLKEALK